MRFLFWFLVLTAFFLALAGTPASQPAHAEGSPEVRVLARSADLILKVPDFEAARSEVVRHADEHRGQVRDARTHVDPQGKKDGWVLLEMDAAELTPFLAGVRAGGKLFSDAVKTDDHTSAYMRLERRIEALRRNEQELVDFLHRPRRMRGSDILFIQYRLFQTRTETGEALQSRIDLERSAQRSLVRVLLFEPERERRFWDVWRASTSFRNAQSSFLLVLRKGFTLACFVLWFTPLWLPALLLLRRKGPWLWQRGRSLWALRHAGTGTP